MPQVIVIDEIGTELEAAAARTIAERGVQLVGTAHGNELDNLMQNPTLSDLIGGIQAVTLGDEEARRRGTQKTVLERKAPPTFDVVVEIQDWNHVVVHQDVAETVDTLLRAFPVAGEVRTRDDRGEVKVETPRPERAERPGAAASTPLERRPSRGNGKLQPLRVYPFGIGRSRIEQAARELHVPVTVVQRVEDADLVLTQRNYYRGRPDAFRGAEAQGITIHVLKSNTVAQIEQALAARFELATDAPQRDPIQEALEEAERAVQEVIDRSRTIEVSPRNAHIRRLQHAIAEQHNVGSRSRGKEPNRRVKFFPREYDEVY
jgi:hypothetical protein